MDYGIYYIDNSLENWQPYNTNLPNVIINELDINNETNTLYAASYGRGLWASPLVEDVLAIKHFIDPTKVVGYPNPVENIFTINLPVTTNVDVRVFDTQGKLVQFQRNIENTNTIIINTQLFNKGVYYVRLETDLGEITKKFIK